MRASAAGFPHLRFGGSAEDRGSAYGEALRDRIGAAYELYMDKLFAGRLEASTIRARAERIRTRVRAFCPDIVVELDAVARASALPTWQLYALNARTEILNAPVPECTALFFETNRLLGQNWDWVAQLEELAVLVTWELPNGCSVLTFTEPGMLGKIGLNDRGLGVCLNFLVSPQDGLDGVPVHILTRTLLDCGDVAEAKGMLARSGFGKSSNFLLADASGNASSVEFAAGERYEVESQDGVLVHTNHCIAKGAERLSERIPTSVERFDEAQQLLAGDSARDLDLLRDVLLDAGKGKASINMSYHPEPLLGNQDVGTCATILMDLAAREMHVAKGPGGDGGFTRIRVGTPREHDNEAR